jgi:glycosyltransferase involved in cell wall biosynthesis
MAILVNRSNRIVEIDNQDRIESAIKKGFRFATKIEKRKYFRSKKKVEPIKDGVGVFFRKNNDNPHGYGQSTEPLIMALEDAGLPVTHDFTGQEVGVVYSYPHPLESLQTKKKVLYSMFESTSIDPEWIPYLEVADKIFVPSKFCRDAFATRGISTEVIPLGYNSDNFYYREKKDDGVFTFTMYNAFDMRKGWDIVFGAFVEEFGKQEDVKLILKSVQRKLPFPIIKSQYPNVELILQSVDQSVLRELLYDTDCFVFPSRGEGFGLTPLEALACGTTAIIPNASGMSEYFDDRYFIELEVDGLRPAIYENFDISVVGEMVEPSKKDLRKKMRWAYENREKVWEMGKEGAVWAKDNYTIRKTGIKLASALRKLGVKSEEVKNITIMNPKRGAKSVAFFLKNRDMYSGGRIFCYQVIHALCKLGYDVTVYTNMRPPWENELKWCHLYRTYIVDIEELRGLEVEADIYMGAVIEGNVACARNGIRTGRPAYCFTFDPIPMVEKYDAVRLDIEKEGYFEVDNLIKGVENIHTVFLTEFAKEECKDYYPDNPKHILQPCVNDLVADQYKNERENIVIASATTGERDKGFEQALKVFSLAPDDWVFHIFTSSMSSQLDIWIEKYDLYGRVIPHYDKNDNEKFEMYSKAKVMFCPSPYEGYGMWLAEGRYMGLECVIVDSGALREVAGDDKHIHIAERDNELDLAMKLTDAMKVDKFVSRKKEFKFENLVDNLSKLLK